MYDLLKALRIVEASSFIAGPSCGLHLAQMGAEVIRLDPIGGGPDRRRWPRTPDGSSLYWEGLNKGKSAPSHFRATRLTTGGHSAVAQPAASRTVSV